MRALYDYDATANDELSIRVGDIIEMTVGDVDGWTEVRECKVI